MQKVVRPQHADILAAVNRGLAGAPIIDEHDREIVVGEITDEIQRLFGPCQAEAKPSPTTDWSVREIYSSGGAEASDEGMPIGFTVERLFSGERQIAATIEANDPSHGFFDLDEARRFANQIRDRVRGLTKRAAAQAKRQWSDRLGTEIPGASPKAAPESVAPQGESSAVAAGRKFAIFSLEKMEDANDDGIYRGRPCGFAVAEPHGPPIATFEARGSFGLGDAERAALEFARGQQSRR